MTQVLPFPYLVLQYFFGGLDLVADLFSFVVTLLVASVMTAGCGAVMERPLTVAPNWRAR